ncbi:MAG: hypothetical protein K8R53_12310 [Bacteroidales bacterium]|nr:hypothetical protein [Bacteroidales bacterium]
MKVANKKLFLVYVIVICFSLPLLEGCKSKEIARAEKENYKRRKKSAKEEQKTYKALKKRHMGFQSDETRKRMKNNEKRAKKLNKSKERKRFFLWKWLGF